MTRWTVRSTAAGAPALTAACAWLPLQPDLAARAPQLGGFGELAWPITTRSPAAQRDFTQGVLQAYAFNEVEAVRMFEAALAQDPACAMCAWGLAQALGQHARGVAAARTGRLDEARLALVQVQGAAASLVLAHAGKDEFDQALRGLADAVTERLQAELALAEGHLDTALKLQAAAVVSATRIDDYEPPWLAAGNRLVLGQTQLRAGWRFLLSGAPWARCMVMRLAAFGSPVGRPRGSGAPPPSHGAVT